MSEDLFTRYAEILNSFNIKPTQPRIEILKIILERLPKEFTITELLSEIEKEGNNPMYASFMIETIGLFRIKGLLEQVIVDVKDNFLRKSETKLICTIRKQE